MYMYFKQYSLQAPYRVIWNLYFLTYNQSYTHLPSTYRDQNLVVNRLLYQVSDDVRVLVKLGRVVVCVDDGDLYRGLIAIFPIIHH